MRKHMISGPTESSPNEPARTRTSIPGRASGFTLIEILIAILIFGILVTTLFGSFRAVFYNTEGLENDSKVFEMAKNCLHRMTLDLQAIHISRPPEYKLPGMNDAPNPYRFIGEVVYAGQSRFPRLRFASAAHIPFEKSGRDGIAEIVYYVQALKNGGFVLRRSDTLFPHKDFEENAGDPMLSEQVKSLTFTYFDAEGGEHESWDSESDRFRYATPVSISIRLEIGDESSFHTFETMIAFPAHRERIG
jgi:general secretion pathway protein J